ncbi:MAG: hypothetical protein GY716_16025 [bacterium]|nr:hypothetical protein [bacterium]
MTYKRSEFAELEVGMVIEISGADEEPRVIGVGACVVKTTCQNGRYRIVGFCPDGWPQIEIEKES